MSSTNQPAVTLSIRILPETRDKLEGLSEATSRTKSFLAAEVIESYLAVHAWQIKAIKKSLDKANTKKANFTNHDKVVAWLESWGTNKESEQPKMTIKWLEDSIYDLQALFEFGVRS
jgi:RHH-type transcriptional regulator, rel operon repressor / antitoxin RelB